MMRGGGGVTSQCRRVKPLRVLEVVLAVGKRQVAGPRFDPFNEENQCGRCLSAPKGVLNWGQARVSRQQFLGHNVAAGVVDVGDQSKRRAKRA